MPPLKARRNNNTHLTSNLGVRPQPSPETPGDYCRSWQREWPSRKLSPSPGERRTRTHPGLPKRKRRAFLGCPGRPWGFSRWKHSKPTWTRSCHLPQVTLPGLGGWTGSSPQLASNPTDSMTAQRPIHTSRPPALRIPARERSPPRQRARPGVPGVGAERPALTRAKRRAAGRSPAPGAGGAAPSSSPPSGWRGRGEAAHPPPGSGGSGGAGTRGGRR